MNNYGNSIEAKEIIRNLKQKDYRYRYPPNDKTIDTDYLYVFHQKWSVPSYDGIGYLNDIFIKVCYLKKNDKSIVGVSFHD